MRRKGKIASWNDEKGYGFIAPHAGGKQLLVHIRAFGNRDRRPAIDDVVTYAVSADKQGRPRAANAVLAGDKPFKRRASGRSKAAILFALAFLCAVAAAVRTGYLSTTLGIVYGATSLVTFIVYAIDKSNARRGAWRTPESSLHLLGLAGGWPGALLAQQVLRHKSKKASFRTVFWLTVLLNCGALVWLHSESGRTTLEGLLARAFQ